MNKVTTINLSGRAYQLEEQAYEALHKYLTNAGSKLGADPDKDEIIADLEQAIAEKCDAYLHASKNVVTASEVKSILADMGPVDATSDGDTATDSAVADDAPKRLHLLKEGSLLAGVCTGIAAYFNLDVTVVRLVFVLAAFASGGSAIFVYIILALIVPEAKTPEQRAEAHGERFNANEVIGRAKQKYAEASGPTFSRAGNLIGAITRMIAAIAAIGLALGVILLTSVFANTAWVVAFGNFHLADQLQTVSVAALLVALFCLYYIVMAPMVIVGETLRSYAQARSISKKSTWWMASAVALWFFAAATLTTIGAVHATRIRDYASTHDTVSVYGHQVCINAEKCGHMHEFRSHDSKPNLDIQTE